MFVGPSPSFEEHLVIFDHFWDFDNLSKKVRKAKRRSSNLDPLFGSFLGPFWIFGDNVTGPGCWPMGLPMFRPLFVMYK
jgi:hypothetical protein